MNFDLDEDEVALQKGIRELCRARAPLDRIRSGMDRGLWRELGEAGVFALRLPESDGGVGLGTTQAVLVFEELGSALVPGPLVGTHLAAGLLEGAALGERVVGVVERGQRPILVDHLDGLDDLLVVDEEGISRLAPDSVQARAVDRPLDPLTPMHVVDELPAGEALGDPEEVVRFSIEGVALTAALLLGIARETTDLAVAYAKERVQFDRPIGSFQAVKHILADMLVRTEIARASVYAAGVRLDELKGGEAARAVAGAKLLAGEAAMANGKACIQVHGGMGFTWEAAPHLYLKRAAVLSTAFGSADHLADAMAGHLAPSGGSPL